MSKEEFCKETTQKPNAFEKIYEIGKKDVGFGDIGSMQEIGSAAFELTRERSRIGKAACGQKENSESLKKEAILKFAEKYPRKKEETEMLFGLAEGFHLHRVVAERQEEKLPCDAKSFLKLAKWQGDLTEFVIAHSGNKEYLDNFWRIFHKIGNAFAYNSDVSSLRSGILGQAELWHLLKENGLKPKMATPEEDAFRQTDIWVQLPDRKIPIQAKREKGGSDLPTVKSTNEIDYPAILMPTKDAEYYFSSNHTRKMIRFSRNCQKLIKEKNIKIKGLYVILPHAESDPITGKPSQKMIKAFREAIGNKIIV